MPSRGGLVAFYRAYKKIHVRTTRRDGRGLCKRQVYLDPSLCLKISHWDTENVGRDSGIYHGLLGFRRKNLTIDCCNPKRKGVYTMPKKHISELGFSFIPSPDLCNSCFDWKVRDSVSHLCNSCAQENLLEYRRSSENIRHSLEHGLVKN